MLDVSPNIQDIPKSPTTDNEIKKDVDPIADAEVSGTARLDVLEVARMQDETEKNTYVRRAAIDEMQVV